jgi:hypothetical protein
LSHEDPFEQLVDGLIGAHAIAMTARAIARELIIDLARLQPNPDRYLTGLYDRVIAHLDPDPSRPDHAAIALARDLVGTCFRDAMRAVQQDPSESPP